MKGALQEKAGELALGAYSAVLRAGAPFLRVLLERRARLGKEDRSRLGERMGIPSRRRPEGRLVWVHAASVGEAQSALILVKNLIRRDPDLNLLVTTGTLTSASLMQKRLPLGAFHQFCPLDHPGWVAAFLDHWRPDAALWMESEFWPNLLGELKRRAVPTVLVNGRLSERSARRWARSGGAARHILETFSLCLAQTQEDGVALRRLGAREVIVTDTLKYGADPLPFDQDALDALRAATQGRKIWLFASTHAGEEEIACRIHARLKALFPEILTIIVPRHPDRREEILFCARQSGLAARLRGGGGGLPQKSDDIYIADTLGELGLFYSLAPMACIGKSLSSDGGGGHNPIEAAQLGCAVLYGPMVQNFAEVYREMEQFAAALCVEDETELESVLTRFMIRADDLDTLARSGRDFADRKASVSGRVMSLIDPILNLCEPDRETKTEQNHVP